MTEQKKRGRPAGSKTQSQIECSRVDVDISREDQAHTPSRPARVRMVAGQKLAVGRKDPNFEYRWFNDKPGRLDSAQAAWWEFVSEGGERIKRHAGTDTMYLMRIEKKYFDEDQNLKQRNVVDTLKAENNLARDEYIPEGRHHVLQKDDDYDPLG